MKENEFILLQWSHTTLNAVTTKAKNVTQILLLIPKNRNYVYSNKSVLELTGFQLAWPQILTNLSFTRSCCTVILLTVKKNLVRLLSAAFKCHSTEPKPLRKH